MPGFLLPIYDLINDNPLLGRSFAEINAGGFDAFVAHKISEECDVIATLQEALCKVRTPLCKISSTSEIEQRFRLN